MGMDKRVKELWLAALRSGKYQQGRSALRIVEDGRPKHCCLGVLCDLYRLEHPNTSSWSDTNEDRESFTIQEESGEDLVLPEAVREWAGLTSVNPSLIAADGAPMSAANWNDGERGVGGDVIRQPATFTEIAAMIEASL